MLDHKKARDVRGLIGKAFRRKRPVLVLTEDVANAAIRGLIERNCRGAGPVVVRGGYRMKEQIRSTEKQPNQYGHGRADNRADYSADNHGAPVEFGKIVRVMLGPCLIGSLIGTVLGALLIRLLGLG